MIKPAQHRPQADRDPAAQARGNAQQAGLAPRARQPASVQAVDGCLPVDAGHLSPARIRAGTHPRETADELAVPGPVPVPHQQLHSGLVRVHATGPGAEHRAEPPAVPGALAALARHRARVMIVTHRLLASSLKPRQVPGRRQDHYPL